MKVLECCRRRLLRLGKVGRDTWFQCVACDTLYVRAAGSRRLVKYKPYCSCKGCKP